MMKAQKLWSLVSTIARRRVFTSTNCRFASTVPYHCSPTPAIQTPIFFSTTARTQFLKFTGKPFCSESSRKVDTRCWNCNAEPRTELFLLCDTCRAIQPVDHSVDYFQIFGVEKKYKVEDGNLEGKYKEWQKKLHPDLVHSKSQKERGFAAEQSARVIDAYRTLGDSLSRAIYILKLEGIHVDEEQTVAEPDLLAEIMEIREAIEDASDSQALNDIKSLAQEKLEHWSNSFAYAFQSRKFDEAVNCIQRMTYYDRVNKEIVKRL